jgi:DNA-binding MarR family transcriptional regulator
MSIDQQFNQVLREWVEIYMRRSFHDFKRFMDENELSPSQAGTLMRLYRCGAVGISDIAGHQSITTPAASQMVDRLVQQGLLQRAEDPNDRRYKQVTLTERGRTLIEEGIRSRQIWMEDLTAAFTPEDQNDIIEVLIRLTDAARQLEGDQP